MSHSLRRTVAPALTLTALLFAAVPAAAAPPSSSPLSAQPSAQSFGLVPVDWGEQNSSVWIQNTSPDPVSVGGASVDGDSALRVSSDGCAGQLLASGQSCNIGIGFDPSDGVAYAATLHVPAAGFPDLEVPLSGTGAVQRVELSPTTLDFGAVAVGEHATRTVTLTSTGNLPFQSIVALPSGGDVGAFHVERDGCSLQELTTGVSCDLAVRFTPSEASAYAATLLLVGGNSEPAIVPLHGAGFAAAAAAPPAPPVAPAGTAAAAPPPVPFADIAFARPDGRTARFLHGRIDLGRARCAGAARCTVVVRSRVYALPSATARAASLRNDVVLWRLGARGRRVSLALPASLPGTPALLVATLRTRAPGQRAGTRTLVVPLSAG